MEVLTAVAAWAISATCRNAAANSWLHNVCARGDNGTGLAARLSQGAQVYFPGSDNFTTATNRWSVLDAPVVNMVVVPAVESDVSEIVKYANEKNIPFLPVNNGHGAVTTVGRMQSGIEIWLHALSSVELSADRRTAKFGGGTLSKTVIDFLWAAGKQTVTGACECTSYLGVGLGGGHGFLQGRHGLMVDQYLSMDIVLSDGSTQTINKTSDLWWAIRGAGHNFGIVTSVTSKIYDIRYPDWAYVSYIFTGDKVEALYEAVNENLLKNGTQPVEIMEYSFWFNNPEIDPNNAVIMFFILQEGVTAVESIYRSPFDALGAIVTDAAGGLYTDLPPWTGNSNEDAPCQKTGLVNTRYPIDIAEYNIPAQRQVFDLFSSATHDTPALNGSLFLFEGYPLQGVQAVPSDSTAFPFRGDNLLVAPLLSYAPGGPELDRKASELGETLRRIIHEGTGREEMHTYVNYAFGDESTQNWYGYEPWRQERLLALKNKYDPRRKFSFYAPIA